MAHPIKEETKKKVKSEIREEAGRVVESLALKFAGYELGLSPEEFENIYNNVVSLYEEEQQEQEEAKRQHRLTRLYAMHRAKKAVRKAVKKEIKKKVARQAAQQALSRGASAGVAATEGFLAANAVDTAGLSLAIAVALQAAIEAFRFIRDPEEETKKILKIIIISIIIVFSIIIFVFYMIMIQFGIFAPKAAEKLQAFLIKRNSLIITKTSEPPEVKSGVGFTYKIAITAEEGAGDVTVIDTLPAEVSFVKTSNGVVTVKDKTITWKSSENGINAPFNAFFTIDVTPNVKDAWIVNKATGLSGGGGGGSCGAPNTATSDFATLLSGQSHCTAVLGAEDNFVTTAIKNDRNLTGKESNVRTIYQAATSRGINPLILLSIWWLETGYGGDGTNQHFNCKPGGGSFIKGFDTSLTCAANAAAKWMNDFERIKASGQFPVKFPNNGASCPLYTEPFVYAFEWLTPICHYSDRNENARANFVKKYKILLGV